MTIATELNNYAGLLEDAWDKAEEKGVEVPVNRNMENLVDAIETIQTSTEVLNGVIEEYKASTTDISAGTFVEFAAEHVSPEGEMAQLSTVETKWGGLSAVQIDTNKVFVAYKVGALNYAVICTISGTTITTGAAVQISTHGTNNYRNISAVLIDTNKVFVAYYGPYAVICTISGTTITVGQEEIVSSNALSTTKDYAVYSAAVIDVNKVVVIHGMMNGSSTSCYYYATACTISGTTITTGTSAQIGIVAASTGRGQYASVVKIDSSSMFVAFNTTNLYLNAVVCTISGTTITTGTAKQLRAGASYGIAAARVDAGKVIVVYRYGDALYAVICTISGTTITTGTAVRLSSYVIADGAGNVVVLPRDANKVFVVYIGSGQILYSIPCTISGTTITTGAVGQLAPAISLSPRDIAATLISEDEILVVEDRSEETSIYYPWALLASYIPTKITSSTDKIDGLTKTDCTTSTAGEVWVLDVSS